LISGKAIEEAESLKKKRKLNAHVKKTAWEAWKNDWGVTNSGLAEGKRGSITCGGCVRKRYWPYRNNLMRGKSSTKEAGIVRMSNKLHNRKEGKQKENLS